jgi:hypothetical protein
MLQPRLQDICALQARAAGERRDKKMPANGGRAQPKIGPRDAEIGAVCGAGRGTPSAITHIGCVYADELSIGRECDYDMTGLKRSGFTI